MRTRLVCAALLACLPARVGAQTLSLTEADAVARLSPDSPRVVLSRAGIAVARADVLAAGRWPNPRVTANREAVSGIAEHITTVSQALPITGRRRLAMGAASLRADAAGRRADEVLARLEADVRLAFTGLWLAETRERELTRSRDELRELAGVLARREAAGDAAGFDRLRAEREVMEVDADRAAAATERAQALVTLAGFFKASSFDVAAVTAVRPEPDRSPLLSLDALVSRAEGRGALAALRHERAAAGVDEQVAARRRIPEPELVAGTKSSTAAGGDIGSIVSVLVSVPLFDRAGADRAVSRARAAEIDAEAGAFRRILRSQIAAWRIAALERRVAADRYRASAASADEITRIAQVSYDAGERGILELLDATRVASTARVRMAALDAAAREAEIELEFVSGGEIR